MFRAMLIGALTRQHKKLLLIAFSITLGISLATAMLNVMFDIGDKVNQELKAYGANLNVVPKGVSLVNERYELAEQPSVSASKWIAEEELTKLKMIFWAYNIVDFAPYLEMQATVNQQPVMLVGTWLNKHLQIPTGDEVDTGMLAMKSWWSIEGQVLADADLQGAMLGGSIAQKLGLKLQDTFQIHTLQHPEPITLTVRSIFHSGGMEDQQIVVSLPLAQQLAQRAGVVQRVEVSALTTPENDLARRAAQDPNSLSRREWDTWYCTAYISSIAYQIEEIMPDVRVKGIMQVAESEGVILQKTQLMMLLLTALSLICSALAISNLVTASVIERSTEIGLLKALGASTFAVSLLILTEILITALIGGVLGYFLGLGFAQIIGQGVFGAAIETKMVVIPFIAILVLLITLIGSMPALRFLMSLNPKQVLHGR